MDGMFLLLILSVLKKLQFADIRTSVDVHALFKLESIYDLLPENNKIHKGRLENL